MKINFDTLITDLDGHPVPVGDAKDAAPMSLKFVCTRALLNPYQGEQPDGEESFKLGKLAERVYAGGEVEISAEEAATLKLRVGKHWTQLVVLRAWPLLDGNAE